jgi:hypothetical protein
VRWGEGIAGLFDEQFVIRRYALRVLCEMRAARCCEVRRRETGRVKTVGVKSVKLQSAAASAKER